MNELPDIKLAEAVTPAVILGVVGNLEIRLTMENQIFVRITEGPHKDRTTFPYARGLGTVFFDWPDFTPTPEQKAAVCKLLRAQRELRDTHHREPVHIPHWN